MNDKNLECQLLNQFQNGEVVTWADLLKNMADAYGRNRDEVFNGMNSLIDRGKIVMPETDVYCTPPTLKRVKEKQAKEEAYKQDFPNGKMTRKEYDRLHPYKQAEFIRGGGKVV